MAVHFIKKNMWYLETALALLEGDDYSEAEKYERGRYLEMEREMHDERQFGVSTEMEAMVRRDLEWEDQDDVAARDKAEEAAHKHNSPDEKLQREF